MATIDERVLELEKRMAIVQDVQDKGIEADKEFQKEIKETLDYFKQRNYKVDQFIEEEMQARKNKADFWREWKNKVATAGALSALGILCSVIWYAAKHYILTGGK